MSNNNWLKAPILDKDVSPIVEKIQSSLIRKKLLELSTGTIEIHDTGAFMQKITLNFERMHVCETEIEDFKRRLQTAFTPLFSDSVLVRVSIKHNRAMGF